MGNLPVCVANVLLFMQHAVIPGIPGQPHPQQTRANRFRLGGVGAGVVEAVPPEYPPAVYSVQTQQDPAASISSADRREGR